MLYSSHNDPPLYKILGKVNSDHLYCNPGISPDIKDFKFVDRTTGKKVPSLKSY